MTSHPLDEKKYTIDEVARALGVSKMTVYRLVGSDSSAKGRNPEPTLRAFRVGRKIMVWESELHRFLADAEREGV